MKHILLTLLVMSCGTHETPTDQCVTKGTKCNGPDHRTESDSGDSDGGKTHTDGKDGAPGASGAQGAKGDTGSTGPQGPTGPSGTNGSSCSVTQGSAGATIKCTDGTTAVISNGTNGRDGRDATPSAYAVVEIIDPCGKQASYDEVLLKMANGQLLAHYSDGVKQYLTVIGPGRYITTDGTSCLFTINSDGSVIW